MGAIKSSFPTIREIEFKAEIKEIGEKEKHTGREGFNDFVGDVIVSSSFLGFQLGNNVQKLDNGDSRVSEGTGFGEKFSNPTKDFKVLISGGGGDRME